MQENPAWRIFFAARKKFEHFAATCVWWTMSAGQAVLSG
jgi:hypothetical protein